MGDVAYPTLPPVGAVVGVNVFVNGPGGGNPVPLVADATGMDAAAMQQVARHHGHESAFLLPAGDERADWRLRFFVPQHEMEMCGHATVGSLWAMRQWGMWSSPTATIETLSGLVDVKWDAQREQVWISQPAVRAQALTGAQAERVASVLRLETGDSGDVPMTNAATSRVKTLVELPAVDMLQGLRPDFGSVEAVCEAIGSTGLYPYALADAEADSRTAPTTVTVFARQFPKSSGYPEDAATGIAAAALWGHLQASGRISAGTADDPVLCVVRQGDAMGAASAIEVLPRFDAAGKVTGCWLSGKVQWITL